MSARVPRVAALLDLFVSRRELKVDDVCAALQWEKGMTEKTFANCKRLGYLEFAGEKVGRAHAYRLTNLGKYRAGTVDTDPRESQQAPAAIPILMTSDAVREAAIALVLSSPGGMDSDHLADALGCSSFAVETALAGYGKFVTCKVMRGGDDFILYRESASPRACKDWQKLGPLATVPPVGVEHSSEFDFEEPAAEEPAPEVESFTQSSDDGVLPEDTEQFFCLYSTGDLVVQRVDGTQVHFDKDETRALFQWLDRIGGTHLERLTAPEVTA